MILSRPAVPGSLLNALLQGFLAAFDLDGLERLARSATNKPLGHIVSGNSTLPDAVYGLLTWAEREGRLTELVDAAVEQVPGNDKLAASRSLYRSWEAGDFERGTERSVPSAAPPGAVRNGPSSVGPEAVLAWAEGLSRATEIVGLLSVGEEEASAFLLTPSLLLTARHAVGRLIGGRVASGDCLVRFGHIEGRSKIREVKLAERWLVDEDKELDFALLLLGPDPGGRQMKRLLPAAGLPNAGDPLFMLGHVFARPAEVECVWLRESGENHIAYETDGISKPGMSGAPVCNARWEIVGMHLLRDLAEGGGRIGRAARLDAILARERVRLALAVAEAHSGRPSLAATAV